MTITKAPRRSLFRTTMTAGAAVLGAAILAPTAAQAAPTPAPTSAPVAASTPAPIPSSPGTTGTQPQEKPQWVVKGTSVTVRNTGDQTMYVRKYSALGKWYAPEEVRPGDQNNYSDRDIYNDDVELRIFLDRGKSDRNEGGFDVDANNPSTGQPNISVDWVNKWFSVGDTTTWVTSDGTRFWAKRDSDSDRFKQFQLHITNS